MKESTEAFGNSFKMGAFEIIRTPPSPILNMPCILNFLSKANFLVPYSAALFHPVASPLSHPFQARCGVVEKLAGPKELRIAHFEPPRYE